MVVPVGELEVPGEPPLPTGVPASQIQGRSPWYLAWLRLRRNKVALVCGGVFVLIVLFCLAAPVWAEHVAHTGPNENHITEKILIDGQPTNVVAPDGTPLGPGLHGQYLLGADQNGRDVMVRLMYGGRDVDLHRPGSRRRHHGAVRDRRAARRVLPRLDRLRAVPNHGCDLGLSGSAPRHRIGHRAGHRRSQGRAPGDCRRFDLDTDSDHRIRLRAVHGQTDQGRNSGAA
jgi:hypothetical protein